MYIKDAKRNLVGFHCQKESYRLPQGSLVGCQKKSCRIPVPKRNLKSCQKEVVGCQNHQADGSKKKIFGNQNMFKIKHGHPVYRTLNTSSKLTSTSGVFKSAQLTNKLLNIYIYIYIYIYKLYKDRKLK